MASYLYPRDEISNVKDTFLQLGQMYGQGLLQVSVPLDRRSKTLLTL